MAQLVLAVFFVSLVVCLGGASVYFGAVTYRAEIAREADRQADAAMEVPTRQAAGAWPSWSTGGDVRDAR